MRSGPTPALQNVLVARPGAASAGPAAPGAPSQALVRRDDLLAAAALAAAAEDVPARARPRSGVLAAVSRRFSRLSGSLRRRRHHPPAAPAPAPVPLAAPDAPARRPALHRHSPHQIPRRLAFDADRGTEAGPAAEMLPVADDDAFQAEAAVASLRDPASRRLRQVGAREDDDTLLMLPRVASVSFSREEDELPRSHTPRVRQLPRVSALMPVRPAGRPGGSPVSSEGARRSGSYGSAYDEDDDEDDERRRRQALCRLPTGMTNVDVERGIEAAVVEIASDGESDADQGNPDRKMLWAREGEVPPGEARLAHSVSTRSRSEMHHQNRPRSERDDAQVIAAFSRRISSSTHSTRRMLTDSEVEAARGDIKSRAQRSQDFALFEDDYLSFQGFHAQPESSRSHYQSMSSLLRSKRISSVTDSHSEDSDEAANVKAISSTDSRWRMGRRTPMMPYVFRMKRGVVLDDDE